MSQKPVRSRAELQASRGVADAFHYQTTDHSMKDFESKWHYYRCPKAGERSVHPRVQADERIQQMTHGKVIDETGGHVADLMQADKSALQSFAYTINAQRERVYRSSKQERLEKVPEMPYELPKKYTPANHNFPGFGVPSDTSTDAKKVIYPQRVQEEATTAQHSGRPKGVDWGEASIDPKTYVFGKVDKNWESDGVRKCMAPATNPVTRIVGFNQHQIAASRKPMERSRVCAVHVDPNLRLGKPSGANDENRVSARLCMTAPDAGMKYDDVGVSSRRARGKLPQQVLDDEKSGKVFGLPGVRMDVKPPKNRRTDDGRNFGDECRAGDLVSSSDIIDLKPSLVAPTRKDAMKKLLDRAGFELADADFDAAWDLAVSKYQFLVDIKPWDKTPPRTREEDTNGAVSSPEAMKRACQELGV